MATSNKNYLVLDLGTTNIKAFVFDSNCQIITKEQIEVNKNLIGADMVEQNPHELISCAINVLKKAVTKSGLKAEDFESFGITTQRETTILWNSENGQAIYPAIVWEDSRTEKFCQSLKQNEHLINYKTGLTINPYFSASKINWIMQKVPEATRLLEQGKLLFGTPDTWLIWNLTKDHKHLSDYTNACRTLLFNVHTLSWDDELLNIFKIPKEILPQAQSSKNNFGLLDSSILGFPLPIKAVCGDQQASLFAAGEKFNTAKITFGTGTFIMQVISNFNIVPGFFTTIAGYSEQKAFAVEAKINVGAKQVEPLLNKPLQLKELMYKIAGDAVNIIKTLPNKPSKIIIDGGITQYPDLDKIIFNLSGLPTIKQQPYDGTALGVAKLLASR